MTAENARDRAGAPLGGEASMRPRPMTAENRLEAERRAEDAHASMRPRPMTAENFTPAASAPAGGTRFNEAAADDRGKRPASSSIASRSTTLQ